MRYVFVSQTFSGISFSIAVNTETSVFRSVIGRKCAGKNDGPNGALKVRTWRVNNLFKQYSRPAGIPDIRHSKASDGINATFYRKIRTPHGEGAIKHTRFSPTNLSSTQIMRCPM